MNDSLTYGGRTLALVATAALKPHPRNARRHPAKQQAALKASVARFGFNRALFVNGDNVILAGHGAWEAALANGIDHVPVIRVPDMNEADQRAFMLADNRLGELSDFDREMLNEELEFLIDAEFEIELTGFDMGDIDFSFDVTGSKPDAEPAVALPPSDVVPITRPGDLWRVGPHRLYCGDACDIASYEALLGSDRAQMIFSDPPYNVPIAGHVSGLGKTFHREFAVASGDMSDAEFTGFLRSAFRLLARFTVGQHDIIMSVSLDDLVGSSADNQDSAMIDLKVVARIVRAGVRTRIAIPPGDAPQNIRRDPALIRLIAGAYAARQAVETSSDDVNSIARAQGRDKDYFARLVRLGYLAPDIVTAILDGRQPATLTRQRLARFSKLPIDWPAQRHLLGFA
jgi:hypothetical protein